MVPQFLGPGFVVGVVGVLGKATDRVTDERFLSPRRLIPGFGERAGLASHV